MTSNPNYNPNVPLIDDPFKTWQINFLPNFQKLASAFSANHIALDAASNAGNHTFIQLLQQESSQQTGIGEIAVYTKKVVNQTDQVYLRYQGNGQEILLTPYQLYSIPTVDNNFNFFTFLPGSVLVYFGQFTATADTYNLNLYPPVAKNIISMDFGGIGTTGTLTPPASIPTAVGGYYKSITISQIQAGISYYFVVMANI